MPEKILVVDDEPAIVELIAFNLRKAGFETLTAASGEEALRQVEAVKPDLVLLDLMLPHTDGFTVCRQIRSRGTTPIIMLTAKDAEADKVWGLESGADDYITKPFSPRELVARVRAVLRRTTAEAEEEAVLVSGELTVDPARRLVHCSGSQIDLTPKEFDLLRLLMTSQGRVLTRDQLLQTVWGYEYAGGTRTVDVHIRRLRQKIEDDSGESAYIQTLHGVGYRWKVPVGDA